MTEIFDQTSQQIIEEAIRKAEMTTSGEIRLHIEKHCQHDIQDRAAEVFTDLGMCNTSERNAVLFYLALEDKQFAIIGDQGINSKMSDHHWGEIKEHLVSRFRNNQYVLGLKEAILMTGVQMKDRFPVPEGKKNQLLDVISFGSSN